MEIKEIIGTLEAEYGIYICKNGFDYSYIIPNRDALKKKDKERFDKLLELLKQLHFLAASEKQELIREKLRLTGAPEKYLLRDQRLLYVDTTGKSFAAFTLTRRGVIKRYQTEGLPLRKTFEKAQADLIGYAATNNLPLADADEFLNDASDKKNADIFG